jgi:thioredoxin-dependent peroxiredoxin
MAETLVEGAPAPDFRLARDGGGAISLADFKNRKLVLFFYPKADTPGCTIEAKDFSRLGPAFAKAGIAVVGVSADPVKKQDAFKTKHRLATPSRPTSPTRCCNPTGSGAKNPCMGGPIWALREPPS